LSGNHHIIGSLYRVIINSHKQLPSTKPEPGAHRQPEPNTCHIPSDEQINLGAVPSSITALLAQVPSCEVNPVAGAIISRAET
jgi:hypothetical protein